jgi:hypothetical protein
MWLRAQDSLSPMTSTVRYDNVPSSLAVSSLTAFANSLTLSLLPCPDLIYTLARTTVEPEISFGIVGACMLWMFGKKRRMVAYAVIWVDLHLSQARSSYADVTNYPRWLLHYLDDLEDLQSQPGRIEKWKNAETAVGRRPYTGCVRTLNAS